MKKKLNKRLIKKLERESNAEGIHTSERLHRIYKVWAARGIEIPGYFENGKPV